MIADVLYVYKHIIFVYFWYFYFARIAKLTMGLRFNSILT